MSQPPSRSPIVPLAADHPPTPPRRGLFGIVLAWLLIGTAWLTTGLQGSSANEAIAPTKQNNTELAELRRLAVRAPIDELMRHSAAFVVCLTRRYRDDRLLWRGVQRIADHVLAVGAAPRGDGFIKAVVQLIEGAEPPAELGLAERARQLRELIAPG